VKRKKIIFFSILGILCVVYVILGIYISKAIKNPQKKRVDFDLSDAKTLKKLPFELTFTRNKAKQWYDKGNPLLGAQYDGVLKNKSQEVLFDWNVVITVPEGSYVDSSWNGKFRIDKDKLIISYNPSLKVRSVPINESITFGCIMYADKNFVPNECRLVYSTKVELMKYPLFWILLFSVFATIIILLTSAVFYIRIKRLKDKEELILHLVEQSLKTFANTIEAKDKYTKGHSQRVSYYSKKIAEKIGLPDYKVQNIYYAAILHDVGKILIPDEILNKKGKLNKEEMTVMKNHAQIGADIFRDFNTIPNLSSIIKHHHEKYDGSGYPDGLNGKKIPLESRIICIADSFDAMTTTRCYRESIPLPEVVKEIKRCSGTHFDPELASAIISLINSGEIHGQS
jgi:putative nucleotidyltransferase with HDIG domain